MKYSFLCLLFLFAVGVSADTITLTPFTEAESEDQDTYWERFQLFHRCLPMELEVSVSPEAKKIGVTEETLRIIAESRLRSARLYTTEGAGVLGVFLENVGACFNARVTFSKLVRDYVLEEPNLAITWAYGAIVQSRNKDLALNQLTQQVDLFLLEYLRVNEVACGGTDQ